MSIGCTISPDAGVAALVGGLALVLLLTAVAGVPDPEAFLDMPGVIIGGRGTEALFCPCPENDGRWTAGAEAAGFG